MRLVAALAVAYTFFAIAACGGDVVSEPTGGQSESTGQGAAGATSGTGAEGAASASGSGGGAVSSSQSSSSSGPDPCQGQGCGAPCVACTATECFRGFCGESGTCEMPAEACFDVGPMAPCPVAEQAGFQLCADCMSGKGCSFFGCVVSGPSGGDGTCCYTVVGGCVPNP